MGQKQLPEQEIAAFLASNAGHRAEGGALSREYRFETYADGVAFAMAVAMVAERRDHHPDILLRWAKVTLTWSTHDAGGITALDVELSRASDALARKHGASEGS
ncbi:MAG: 4a-hydroxytetrahydrobiopterin dehydratase [Myxococcales bacterium]|nr:4a-hydroxytetrahydrobiopterin dehydratase [Myxococcales bacterium]